MSQQPFGSGPYNSVLGHGPHGTVHYGAQTGGNQPGRNQPGGNQPTGVPAMSAPSIPQTTYGHSAYAQNSRQSAPPHAHSAPSAHALVRSGQGYAPHAAPPKSFVTTWLLSLFLGGWGIDRFYLGQVGLGIVKLLTGGGFGIWALIDLIMILAGSMRDSLGRPLAGYEQNKSMAIWVTVGIVLLQVVLVIVVYIVLFAALAAMFAAFAAMIGAAASVS